jgi:hypothetical protein
MDPFMTSSPRKYRIPKNGMKHFYKQEIIYFIESMSFEYIQVPIDMTTSTDEDLTVAFIQAFCDALADSLVKASPSKSTPKKLVEQIKSSQMDTPTAPQMDTPTAPQLDTPTTPQMDTPTKIPTKPDQPELVKPRTLKEKLALIPSLYGPNPTGKRTSMTPFACHLLTNKGTGPSRSRRPRREYPIDDTPVKPIPEHIAQVLAKDTDAKFKKYKGPYTLHPLYEHDDDPLPFLWINGVVHPYEVSSEDPAGIRRYSNTTTVNADAMYDTGNGITRICTDLVGFELNSGDEESCILTFTYFSDHYTSRNYTYSSDHNPGTPSF